MDESCIPLAPENGVAPVNAPNAPPFTLPDTLEGGMLSPAPSVSAATGLVKKAYVLTVPMRNVRVQLVFTVMVALPLAVPFRTSAKFTVPGDAVTVREVVKFAPRLTPAMLEFSCACAGVPTRSRIKTGRKKIMPSGFMLAVTIAALALRNIFTD